MLCAAMGVYDKWGETMSRYIDADALKEYIGAVRAEFDFFDDDERPRYEAHSKAIYLLDLYVDSAPTIDAVSVVRCKECRYKDMDICPMYRLVVAGVRKPDDYCSYGERKESE